MRINLYGAPGCGKSTLAAKLYGHLKSRGCNIEYVQEYIKNWAYMKRIPQGFEQLYIFASQINSEDILLRHGVDNIISDSPIMMNWAYCDLYGHQTSKELLQIALKWEAQHPALHFWLDKGEWEYSTVGRYESEDDAKNRSEQLYSLLINNGVNLIRVKNDIQSISEQLDLLHTFA